MSNLTISVITPSFNQGKFIQDTIESVLAQNISGLEYVIYDGGSTDNTLDILKNYDVALRWSSGPDKGQADALNKGIENTHGDIIGWLNSDDIYYPQAIQTVLNFFTTHPEIDVIYGRANFIDINGNILGLYPTEPWNPERLKENCYLSQPSVFFRRSIVEKVGLLNIHLNFCMDYEYWIRLMKNGANFAYLPQVLSATRMYAETKTQAGKIPATYETKTMLKQQFGELPSHWLLHDAHMKLEHLGLSSDTNPMVFAFLKPILTLFAAIKWNHKITRTDLNSLYMWYKKSLNRFF